MKVRGDFLGPPRSTDKTTLIIKVIRLQRSGIDIVDKVYSGLHIFENLDTVVLFYWIKVYLTSVIRVLMDN